MSFLCILLVKMSLLCMIPGRAESPNPADLHLLDAKCLDGSPAAYYHRRALNAEKAQNWIVSLQGGGSCVKSEDCAARADTDLGSSLNYGRDGEALMQQFLAGEESLNPHFYDWNHVLLMYACGSHVGP